MSVNIEEYELKDNESNYIPQMQPTVYSSLMYKQTFTASEAYDLDLISLRLGQFNTMKPLLPGQTPVLDMNITVEIRNTTTKETTKYRGIPEGLVWHGILPWMHLPLAELHFEENEKGEIILASEGGYQFINNELRGKSTIFYITRDPLLSYNAGELYRYQAWNDSWTKLLFMNKPYNMAFRLWSKKEEEAMLEAVEPLSICPYCGFVFPLDNTVMPAP